MSPRRGSGRVAGVLCMWAALSAIVCTRVAAAAGEADPAAPPGVFETAAWAPPDATLVVRMRDLAQAWPILSTRGGDAWLELLLGGTSFAEASARIGVAAGRTPAALAAELLHEDATLIRRDLGDDRQWVLMCSVGTEICRDLLAAAQPRPLGGGVFELPAHDLRVVHRAPWLLLSSAGSDPLLRAVLERLGGRGGAASLREGWVGALPHGPQGGHFEVLLQSPAGPAKWAAIGRVEAASVEVRMVRDGAAGEFASPGVVVTPPVERLIEDLRRSAVAVLVEDPSAGLFSDLAAPLLTLLPELSPAAPRAEGVRIWVLGEIEGDEGDPRPALRTPAVAILSEASDRAEIGGRLHLWADRLARGASQRLQRHLTEPLRVVATPEGGVVDPRMAMAELLGGHPLTRRLELAWAASSGESGEWALLASDRTWLGRVVEQVEAGDAPPWPVSADRLASGGGVDEVADSLGRSPPRSKRREPQASVGSGSGVEAFLAQGWVRGDRLARHLAGWAAEAEQFVPVAEASALRSDLSTLADALRALREVHWVTRRDEGGVVGTAVEIRLAAPRSLREPGR
jgi:hypothetical protein